MRIAYCIDGEEVEFEEFIKGWMKENGLTDILIELPEDLYYAFEAGGQGLPDGPRTRSIVSSAIKNEQPNMSKSDRQAMYTKAYADYTRGTTLPHPLVEASVQSVLEQLEELAPSAEIADLIKEEIKKRLREYQESKICTLNLGKKIKFKLEDIEDDQNEHEIV